VKRLSPGPWRHRESRVDVAAVAGVAVGISAAEAIVTQAAGGAAIAVIGLAVMVVTLRRPNPWLATTKDLTTLALSDGISTHAFPLRVDLERDANGAKRRPCSTA
jgi:hypothetical protein